MILNEKFSQIYLNMSENYWIIRKFCTFCFKKIKRKINRMFSYNSMSAQSPAQKSASEPPGTIWVWRLRGLKNSAWNKLSKLASNCIIYQVMCRMILIRQVYFVTCLINSICEIFAFDWCPIIRSNEVVIFTIFFEKLPLQ